MTKRAMGKELLKSISDIQQGKGRRFKIVPPKEVKEIKKSTNSLLNHALSLLARREYSRLELAQKLQRYDAVSEKIDLLLNQLEKEKLLSDFRFTESYIAMRSRHGYGPERITQELRERGVSSEVIDQYLDLYAEHWLEKVKKERQKKFGGVLPKDFIACSKQKKFLYYRGFTFDQIKTIFDDK